VRSLLELDTDADPGDLIERLHPLWRNPSAADPDLLHRMWTQAHSGTGDILECGSGLSTLVLSVAARRTDRQLVTIEHEPRWADANRRRIQAAGAPLQPIRIRPLRDYGDYDWYDLNDDDLSSFSLVVCDGPPGLTRGGRYGLLPTIHERVTGSTIVLDDAGRASERSVLERWEREFGVRSEVIQDGAHKAFAIATVPEAGR
jgi:hypothetical protein